MGVPFRQELTADAQIQLGGPHRFNERHGIAGQDGESFAERVVLKPTFGQPGWNVGEIIRTNKQSCVSILRERHSLNSTNSH